MNHKDTKTQSTHRFFEKVLPEELEKVAKIVVNAAFAVHLTLGPGLLESVYETCLMREIELQGLKVERQVYLWFIC